MKIGIFNNCHKFIGGGVHSYTNYLIKVLQSIPGAEVTLIIPDGHNGAESYLPVTSIVLDDTINCELVLNQFDVIFTVTAYSSTIGINKNWLKYLSTYKGPIVTTIHSWTDFNTKYVHDYTPLDLPNCQFVIDYKNRFNPELIEKYQLTDKHIHLPNYIGYPFIESQICESKTESLCCIGRIYSETILKSCELARSVLGVSKIDCYGNLYSRNHLDKYPNVNIVRETYLPTESLDILKPYKYALFPDIRRSLDTDGSLDWVILEMLATNTVPLIYKTSASLYETTSDIYCQSFDRLSIIPNHTYDEIVSHNQERFKELCSIQKAVDVMQSNLDTIRKEFKS